MGRNGRTVNHTITIGNPQNLTYYEKQVILLTHCGTATFNSFAAEIEFHADGLFDVKALLEEWYKRALRSEMGLGEEPESGFYDKYYDLESDIVQAQAAIHGES